MKRSVIRKFSTLALLAGASLLYGCGNAPIGGIGYGQFMAGAASIAGPIGFAGQQNVTYNSMNLYAQSIQAGSGGGMPIGIAPVMGGVNTGFNLPTLVVQKTYRDGTVFNVTAQSLSTGTQTLSGASVSGSITLSSAIQNIINTRLGNYTQTTTYNGMTPTYAPASGLFVSSVGLSATVNPGGATSDERWLNGWVVLTLNNGRNIIMGMGTSTGAPSLQFY